VSISPVTDGSGEVVNFVGVQNDVTERVMVEQERRSALAEAEESRGQLRLLAEATTQMTGALDVTDACARLARIAVPALADLSAVDLVDQPGRGPSRRVAVAARDAPDEALLRELGTLRAYGPGTATDTGRVLDGGEPVLIAELPERGAERYPDDPAAAAVFERLRLRSPGRPDPVESHAAAELVARPAVQDGHVLPHRPGLPRSVCPVNVVTHGKPGTCTLAGRILSQS